MNILMTQRSLAKIAGSELVTAEISKKLAERGHDVVVYSPRIGNLAKLLWSSKVSTVSALRDVPWTPDVIHGQHHLPFMAALARFAEVPSVYYCHGRPWVETPPRHPDISRYVMMCEWLANSTATELGLPSEMVTVLPSFVNTSRFSEVRTPEARPREALIFGGQSLPVDEADRLATACREHGLKLDVFRDRQDGGRPEIELPKYDIVFAIGRCAIEALACGCAVIPLIPGQAGSLVTPSNFDGWSFSNFSPRYYNSAAQLGTQWLGEQLQRYDPNLVAELTQRVRRERTLEIAVDRLEGLYQEAADAPPTVNEGAFAPYLEALATDVDAMWRTTERLNGEVAALRAEAKRREKPLQRVRRAPAKRAAGGLLGRLRRRLARSRAQ